MGLSLIAPSGYRITQLKHWILRCHACTTLVSNIKKKFCPSCGNPSLIKTSMSVDANTGRMNIYLKKNFQYNLRGSKYSIPKPKGGNKGNSHSHLGYGNDIVLREDQKEYTRTLKAYEHSISKTQSDPDTLPSLLMSTSLRDMMLRKTMCPPKIGYGRSNPNQGKKK